MRKGNSWEILRVFTLSFQNSSDTQTAFPGMENDAQTKSRGKKAAPTWGKKRQFQPGAKKGNSTWKKMFLWAQQGQVGGRNSSLSLHPTAAGTEEPFVQPSPTRRGKRIFPVSLTADL